MDIQVKLYGKFKTDSFQPLKRGFHEQYRVANESQTELGAKEEISSSSVQSLYDPGKANKGNQEVKGYSVNITETCSDEGLSLTVGVLVDKANTSDAAFANPAIEAVTKVTDQQVEVIYADGAYQSPANDDFCKDMDKVFTGIQGAPSK